MLSNGPRTAQGARERSSEQIECRENRGLGPQQRRVLEALGVDDRLEIEQRRLEQGIDYNEVEVLGLRHLDPRVPHPLRDHLRIVLATALQPLQELVPTRRQEK